MVHPLSLASTWDLVAEGYTKTTRTALAEFCREAIKALPITGDEQVIDVACGPGTLSSLLSPYVKHIEAVDYSAEMISQFQKLLQTGEFNNISISVGDGQSLKFDDNQFDYYFSMFGLIFFPDRLQGLREAKRVLKNGGRAVIASWGPIDSSPLMTLLTGALAAGNPDLPTPPDEPEAWDNKETISRASEAAGLELEKVVPVVCEFPVDDYRLFWDFSVQGSAPLQLLKQSQSPKQWLYTEQKALQYLAKHLPNYKVLGAQALLSFLKKSI